MPQNYWAATSHNNVIYKLFENKKFNVNAKFETLKGGGHIREVITEDLTYDSLEASEVNLWSLLFMTGYLTQVKDAGIEELPQETPSGKYRIQEKVAYSKRRNKSNMQDGNY